MYNHLKEVEMEIDKIFRESNDDINAVDNNSIQKPMNTILKDISMNNVDFIDNNNINDPMSIILKNNSMLSMDFVDNNSINDAMSIILDDSLINDIDGLIQFLRDGKKKMEELWKISGEEAAIKLINDRCINFRDFKITAEHYKKITKHQQKDNDKGILGTLADKISVNLLSDFNDLMRMAIKKDASTDVEFYSFGFIRRVAKVWDQVKDKL